LKRDLDFAPRVALVATGLVAPLHPGLGLVLPPRFEQVRRDAIRTL
jgi:hypothetical protein